jgi:NAD(P)-dependent dehydrogenase (short-subunit alcohol dehydrogenase family)
MSDSAEFGYDGRRALVVGGATGMGAAAARTVAALGGDVIVMDIAPVQYDVTQSLDVDLRDRIALDAALEKIEPPIHAIFAAAGVADGTPGIMKVNFIAHRHIIESLMTRGALPQGAAVCMISSVAGLGWENRIPLLNEFLDTPDYEAADAWVQDHPGTDGYGFSKQAMNCYVARRSYSMLADGVRINAICPGPTDTPLARANADTWLAFAQDYRDATQTPFLVPDQMGNAMVFLNSPAASGINGTNLLVDAGHVMSSLTGAWEAGAPMINAMLGRS